MKKILTLMLVMAISLASSPVFAGTLEAELDHKVRAIAQFVKSQQQANKITLAPIGGLSHATGTNRIGAILQEKLAAHQIEMVGSGAPYLLDVELSLGTEDALFIDLELKTDRGQKLREWTGEFEYEVGGEKVQVEVDKGSVTAKIDNPEDVQKVLSIPYADHAAKKNTAAYVNNDKKEIVKIQKQKLKQLAEAYGKPQTHVKDNHVTTDPSALYEMEILTTKDHALSPSSYHALTPIVKDGYSHVDLHKGDMFGVRLYNNSDTNVYVELCLDGINSFHFTTLKNAKHFEVPAHKSILVRGFHQNFDKATSTHHYKHFQVSDYANSAWLLAQQSGFNAVVESQGSIAAHFSYVLPPPRSGNATPPPERPYVGPGKDFAEKADVKRLRVGPAFETVVVRYAKPGA